MNLERYEASTLVEAGGEKLLFDCGRGATIRMAQYGIRLGEVSKVFLTHLHSDYVVDIPDLFLTPWASEEARQVPFEVWGPPGTREMMDSMQKPLPSISGFADDAIVYGRLNGGLFRVPAGGTPVALSVPDGTAGEFSHSLALVPARRPPLPLHCAQRFSNRADLRRQHRCQAGREDTEGVCGSRFQRGV
jgi:hypothetical protein